MISRLLDFFKGTVSLAMLLGLLIGVPILLLLIVGYPLPTEQPSIEVMRAHLEAGDIPDEFIIKALAVVVWIVWAQLAVAILTEGFAMARGRVARRAPLLPGLQLMAGKLVASSVLIVSAFLPSRAATAAPLVPITATEIPADGGIGAPPIGLGGPSSPFAEVSRNGALSVAGQGGTKTGVDASVATGRYETKAGDSWWDMAERLLGDGMRWSELRDLNSGTTMLTGDLVTEETADVQPGWELLVPADARVDLLTMGSAPTPTADQQPEPEADADSATSSGAPPTGVELQDSVDFPDNVDLPDEVELPGDNELPVEADLPTDVELPLEVGLPDETVPTSSPLMEAIKPFSLVYEGPTLSQVPGQPVPYQVVEGDNLWNIADRHLGDPFRWPEIFENSTGLSQTFGRTISDPNLIWPDSVLLLPADADDVPAADAALVEEVLGASSPPATGDTNNTDSAGNTITNDGEPPVVLRPEDLQQAVVGAEGAAEGGSPPDPPSRGDSPDPDEHPVPPDQDGQRGEIVGAFEELGQFFTTPAGMTFGAGGTMVATGLLGLLRRARRLRLTEAGPGTVPAPPPVHLVDVETVLRAGAADRETLSVHHIIGSLAKRTVIAGEPLAAPEVIRIGAERVEVVQLGDDPDLPTPWLPTTHGRIEEIGGRSMAVLPAEFFPQDLDRSTGSDLATPACVTVGGGLLLNLETVGVLAITGPVEASAGLVRSMVHELATGPARRSIDIRISDRLPGADLHDHVRSGPLDGLVDELESWFEDVELGITAAGAFSAYALRAAGDGRSIPAPKVIFADVDDLPILSPILNRARRQAMPLAVVVSSRPGQDTEDGADATLEGAVTVSIDGPVTTVLPHGIVAASHHLEADLILSAEALITHARQAPMVHRDDDQATILPNVDHPTDPAQVATEESPEQDVITERPAEENEITERSDDTDSGVLIRVLGPVDVDGGPDDLTEEERSLLTFLALVGPSTDEQLRNAVWPDGAITDERFASVIDKFGEKLGPLFPTSGDGRRRVRSVITDLGSARRWLAQAASMSDERSRNLTELALSEVRGVPFDGVEPRHWQWVEDHQLAISTQATSLLIDACFDLCDSAYGAGDLGVASWACDVASMIDPIHETVAIRRVQLLGVAGRHDDAAQLVDRWEAEYTNATDLSPPNGPRSALRPREVVSPNVS